MTGCSCWHVTRQSWLLKRLMISASHSAECRIVPLSLAPKLLLLLQGYDLTMKPDISAPGSLYSSLPNSTYQTWPGTSMAAPYMAGVIALWKESMKKQGIRKPKEGWIQAAHIALKNTARPLPYKGSEKFMWSPVKVGAGVVQAYNAVINKVRITPTQLLVRTDMSTEKFTLNISNTGDTDVTYKLTHRPAVTVHLPKTWYGDGFDDQLPVAQVAVVHKEITVPANSKVTLNVSDPIMQCTVMSRSAAVYTSKAAAATATQSHVLVALGFLSTCTGPTCCCSGHGCVSCLVWTGQDHRPTSPAGGGGHLRRLHPVHTCDRAGHNHRCLPAQAAEGDACTRCCPHVVCSWWTQQWCRPAVCALPGVQQGLQHNRPGQQPGAVCAADARL